MKIRLKVKLKDGADDKLRVHRGKEQMRLSPVYFYTIPMILQNIQMIPPPANAIPLTAAISRMPTRI